MEKLLSIVIPVYNMEAYLLQTLDSLVCSEMELLDIIIVNDGSKDGSLAIAQEWASGFPMSATVVDKPNGGHGSAWNAGMARACGKYLAFVDSDDWVHDISSYLQRLKHAEADLVFNDCISYCQKTSCTSSEILKGFLPGVRLTSSDPLPLKENHCRILNFHYCIYSTSMLQKYAPLFHERTSYDDMILFTVPLFSAVTFEYSALPFYVYRIGRDDQSMAPSVIRRKISQQENERKYAIESAVHWACNNGCSVKIEELDSIVNFICSVFYSFLMKLESGRRKLELKNWTDYLEKTLAQPESLFEYSAYRSLPFPFFILAVKSYHLYRKVFNNCL